MKKIFALLTLALVSNLFAEPRQWTEEGVAVAIDRQLEDVSTATNSSGYTLSVWAGSLGGLSVVVGQLVAPTGENLWEDEGRFLAQGEHRAGYPSVIALAGGWIVGWLDATYIEYCDEPTTDGSPCLEAAIRVIKLDNNAGPQWNGDRAGVEVIPMREWADYTPFQLYPSGGGTIVTTGATYEHGPLLARGINANGDPWPEAVEASGPLYGTWLQTTSDMQDGVLIAWSREFYRDSVIHANRLLADGTLAWAGVEGLAVINAHDTIEYVREMCADGFGGMYVGWATDRFLVQHWVQRIDGDGNLIWTNGAVQPCTGSGSNYAMPLNTSYSGDAPDGVLVRFGGAENRLQKLDLDGNRIWGNCGVSTCMESNVGRLAQFSASSDRSGGAIVSGVREVDDDFGYFRYSELRLARVAVDGSSAWEDDCVVGGIIDGQYPEIFRPMLVGEWVRHFWLESDSPHELKYRDLVMATGQPIGQVPTVVHVAGHGMVRDSRSVKLTNGSSAVVWTDEFDNSTFGRYQILNVFGERLLADGGVPLMLNTNGDSQDIADFNLCEDGAGGFFAFAMLESDTGVQLRCVRINGAGEHVTDPEGTIVMSALMRSTYTNVCCVEDGAVSGAFVTASLYESWPGLAKTRVMRVGTDGQPLWASPLVFAVDSLEVYPVALTSTLEQSCLLTTAREDWYPRYTLSSYRISATGSIDWSLDIVDSARYAPYQASICSNGRGGIYACWQRSGDFALDLFAQNVSAEGALLWGDSGVMLNGPESYVADPACTVDGANNLTVVWVDEVPDESNIRAQRLTEIGERVWQEGGVVLCDAPHNQVNPLIISLSDNELYVTWEDYRDDPWNWIGVHLYGTHLNARGEVAGDSWWEHAGNALSPAGFRQLGATLIADGVGGVVVSWMDRRTGFGYYHASLFTQRLYDPIFTDANEKPEVVHEFSLAQNYPNPFNPETVIEFALPTASKATLKVFDLTGRLVATLIDESLAAGVHRANFDAARLASGVYFYRLEAAKYSMTRKMVVLK